MNEPDKKSEEPPISRGTIRDGHQSLFRPDEQESKQMPRKEYPPSLGQHMKATPLGE